MPETLSKNAGHVDARPPVTAPADEALIIRAAGACGLGASAIAHARAMQNETGADLGDVLIENALVDEAPFCAALAAQLGVQPVDLDQHPPDPRLIERLGTDFCLSHGILPWRRVGRTIVFATARADLFGQIARALPEKAHNIATVFAPRPTIIAAIEAARGAALTRRAETRAPEHLSCRGWSVSVARGFSATVVLGLIAGAILIGPRLFSLLSALAVGVMMGNSTLKGLAAIAARGGARRFPTPAASPPTAASCERLPRISVLVPLHGEARIAGRLVRRLDRLCYPRERLEVCLIVESSDQTTAHALELAELPRHFRVVTVPRGTLQTKPRAMNYALGFCRGQIVGVYDAEDAPESDQLFRVQRRFAQAGPELACIQGILDHYNSGQNWLSRCFCIEYATWFRLFLPGLERLGLVVPLGGTTLFFRREALEQLGCWDAHNVTEDADLGIRLARAGFRTEVMPTVTYEESVHRPWAWVRQRSRWLKGFAITYAVHMRDPARLLADLGPKRFAGLQVLLLGTVLQFLMAPLIWSFWFMWLGAAGPRFPSWAEAIPMVFLAAEAINLVSAAAAASGPRHRRLWPWLPVLHLYYPLATVAAYKAVWELTFRPFYWDKTEHGLDMSGKLAAPDVKRHP